MDERVPIEFKKESGEFVLNINAATTIRMAYCAWCGESLDGKETFNPLRAGVCRHIKDLAAKLESSVRYGPNDKEYNVAGAKDISIRLLFCPVCGRKLPVEQTKQYNKSPSEVAHLTKLFANVRSVDQALTQVGQPDFERGPNTDHFYWKGERLATGFKRAIFYERLARTVEVHVVEWLDGKTDVKFFAKPPTRPHRR